MTLLTLFQAVADGTITPQDAEREAVALLVTVKPLAWDIVGDKMTAGEYTVYGETYGQGELFLSYGSKILAWSGQTQTLTEMAQRHHTARILSALTLAPKEDAR